MVTGGGIQTDPAISTLETSISFSWIDLVPSGREGKEGGPSCDQSRKFSIESTVLNHTLVLISMKQGSPDKLLVETM